MKTYIDFQKEEYEKLLILLGLMDNDSEMGEDDYFNVWGFGVREEDNDFTTGSSVY